LTDAEQGILEDTGREANHDLSFRKGGRGSEKYVCKMESMGGFAEAKTR
jgi:hypothetical protein